MGALRRVAASSAARIAIVCVLAGAGAVAGLLVLGDSAAVPAIAPGAPLEVAASFEPATPQFGDRLLARVVVALDPRRVLPQTLRLSDDLGPLTQLGAASASSSSRGSLELVTIVRPVSCLSSACLARSGDARVALPLVRASVRTRDGRVRSVSSAWPTLSVRGRVTASDLAASTPPFQADTAPPPATYRIAPATLAALLDVLAALCALAAVALVGWEVSRLLERRRPPSTALERALRLAREAERRGAPDRRRALALLARALDRDQRSDAARRLAWSRPAPQPQELEELVSEIENGGAR